jgi:hypothetical protein
MPDLTRGRAEQPKAAVIDDEVLPTFVNRREFPAFNLNEGHRNAQERCRQRELAGFSRSKPRDS